MFEQEPLPADSPLLELPNIVVTPHLAASTAEAQDRAGVQVAEQVVAALNGGAVLNALNIPQVGEEEMLVVGPFIPLAEKLGRLAMGLARDSVERIEVATAGALAGHDTRLLTLAALRGAFAGLEEGVNLVNVRGVAENRGIDVTEQRREGASDYQNLIAVTARHGNEESTVVGTTMGRDGRPWLVRVLHYEVELELDPLLLVLENDDTPGMVGRHRQPARRARRQHLEHAALALGARRLRDDGAVARRRAVAGGADRSRRHDGRARPAVADPPPIGSHSGTFSNRAIASTDEGPVACTRPRRSG